MSEKSIFNSVISNRRMAMPVYFLIGLYYGFNHAYWSQEIGNTDIAVLVTPVIATAYLESRIIGKLGGEFVDKSLTRILGSAKGFAESGTAVSAGYLMGYFAGYISKQH